MGNGQWAMRKVRGQMPEAINLKQDKSKNSK